MISRRALLQAGLLTLPAMVFPGTLSAGNIPRRRWQSLAQMPFPVQEIYPALAGEYIHVAGGFAADSSGVAATDRHIRYRIDSNSWDRLAPLPAVRHHLNLVTCGSAIYGLGGFRAGSAGDWIMENQTWVYDIEADSWAEITPASELHGESVCLAVDNVIHVIGGRTPRGERNAAWSDHGDSDRHLLLDVENGQWQRAAPALNARNSAAGAVIDGSLYVVGGRTVSGGNLDHLEVYDPREDKWRAAAPMPQAQGGLAAAAIGGRLMAFGGEYFGPKGHGVHGNAWLYDPARDRWSALPPMPTPRHGLGAISDGTIVFAIGGATGVATNGTSSVVESFSPE